MSKKVFIVDNSKTVLCEIRTTLESQGYQVFEAINGLEAKERLVSQDIDLLITDYYMPELNGIELAKDVRKMEHKRFLPILMMSSNNSEEDIHLGKSLGISAWLNKSCDMKRLPKLVS